MLNIVLAPNIISPEIIRIPFSIERTHQNQVLYGQNDGLHKKTDIKHCAPNIISLEINSRNWTRKIGQPFSIDLNDQKQVPYGQNDALYRILSKIIDFLFFWEFFFKTFFGGEFPA